MSGPPTDDLKDWSKNELVRELRRLRAVMREHADQVEPSHSGGDTVDVAGDPYAQGGALIDARGAVLMDSVDVVLVDTKATETPSMVLRLGGRINYSTARANTAYLFDADGAAAIVTEILGLMQRAGATSEHGARLVAEFKAACDRRMKEMP